MSELDEAAVKKLKELILPTTFSYRQAFIAGYNYRKYLEYKTLYNGSHDSDLLNNNDWLLKRNIH
jgi:hypothetical protein